MGSTGDGSANAANLPVPDLSDGHGIAEQVVGDAAPVANTTAQTPGVGTANLTTGAATADGVGTTANSGADAAIRGLDDKLAKLMGLIEKQTEEIERLKADRDSFKAKAEVGAKEKAILLDEKYFRRLSKFAGEKDKWKSWLFSFTVSLGMVDKRLSSEVIRLLARRGESRDDPYKYDVANDPELDNGVKKYGAELFGLLVDLCVEDSEPDGILKAMQ